jgi:hypothetical protein
MYIEDEAMFVANEFKHLVVGGKVQGQCVSMCVCVCIYIYIYIYYTHMKIMMEESV